MRSAFVTGFALFWALEVSAQTIPQLAKTIDAVLAWDQSHSNALTPRKKYRSQYDQIVAGLTQMRDEVLWKADSIRKIRAANGLGNRS
jgi:hypothetical protein